MFDRLEKRVVATIFIAVAIFVAALSLISAVVVGGSYLDAYQDDVSEAVRIAVDYSAIKLETIKSDAVRVASDDGIQTGLAGMSYVTSINPKLNYFRSQYQEEVTGLPLYAQNGFTYKTDSLPVATVIPFATIAAAPAIAAFLAGEETELVTLLMADAAEPTVRSFAILVKVPGPDGSLGVLFVDVSPDYMFHEYFSFTGHAGFALLAGYVEDGGLLHHPSANRIDSDHRDLFDSDLPGFSDTGRAYAVFEPLYGSTSTLYVAVTTTALSGSLWILVGLLLGIDVLVLTIAATAAKKLSAWIVRRLERLRENMSAATKRIE